VLLIASGSRAVVINQDRVNGMGQIAQLIGRETAQSALDATRHAITLIGKNVNTRLALEVLMLDYPTVST
jgi:hypothetical protein